MKKLISALLLFSILISLLPVTFAETEVETTENIITLSSTETIVVGNTSATITGNYELTHSIGYTSDFFDKPNTTYGGYAVGGNRVVAYKLDVPASGRYMLTMNVTATQGDDDKITVYLDECQVEEVTLPNLGAYTDVDICDLQLTKGTHILLLSTYTGGNNMTIRNLKFTKSWDMEKIVFRAANYDSLHGTENAPTSYNKFDGNYEDFPSTYGNSSVIVGKGIILGFKLCIPETGTYKLSGELGSNGGSLEVRTGSPWAADATIKGNFLVNTGGTESANRIYQELGTVDLAEGTYTIYFYPSESFGYEYLSLELIPDESLIDEINEAKNPEEMHSVINSYSGAVVNEMKYKINEMFYPYFVTASLVNKAFTSLEEAKTAFDEAYAKEADEPNIQLLNVSSSDKSVSGVTTGADYKIKIKEDVLSEGTQVIFVRYRNNVSDQIKYGEIKAGEPLTVGTFWLSTTDRYGLYFWESFGTLKPINFFQ